ncbi:MAG: glycine cleavage system protein GcvH, partial [Gammaproteobacteria bacterium]|nr:glycine cleavage system protein GcvH [Gammaproteobacteria bacterium]
ERQSDGSMRVGITDFAQQQLGDIVFIELPEVGRSYAQDEECGLVESVKSASDIYCPVSGEVIAINEDIEESPEKINDDPYGDGWIFQIMPDSDADDEDLLDVDDYEEHTEEE